MKTENAPLTIAGRSVVFSRSQCEFLFALAEKRGAPVPDDALILSVYGRCLSSAFLGSDDWANLRALAYRINWACRKAGVADVVDRVPGSGYRWSPRVEPPPELTGCEQHSSECEKFVIARPVNLVKLTGAQTTGARA